MRLTRVAAVGLAAVLVAGAAQAQIVWVGAGYGAGWEYKPDTEPGTTWLRGDGDATTIFVGVPIDDDVVVRVAVADVPYQAPFEGEAWPGRFRAYTLGVDYMFTGTFGRSLLSAGAGQYNFRAQAQQPPEDLETKDFGWYVGVGEWFPLTRRSVVSVELTMHRPDTNAKPVLVTGMVGVSF
jgi:hypothetical protein